jgi:BON domain-containing protein
MSRYRIRVQEHDEGRAGGLALLAAGALAGLAAGIYLSQRFGGVAGVSARLRARFGGAGETPGEDEERAATSASPPEAYEEEELDVDDEQFVSANEELEERVLVAFTNDPLLRERAVDIGAIGERTIELTGHVLSGGESEHATVIARGVPGVETVVNRLGVRQDEQDEDAAAARYADADPRYRESRWEGHNVGTGQRRQGSSADMDRHADPKVPLEERWTGADEAIRDAVDDLPDTGERRVAYRRPQDQGAEPPELGGP